MVARESTRSHSLPGQVLGVIAITLGLTVAAFGAYAGVSVATSYVARATAGSAGGGPQDSLPAPATTTTASPDPTPTATTAPTPEPAATPTANATPAPVAAPTPASDGKLIVVSLAAQRLTAYENGNVFLTSVVATGRPALATPVGRYHVMAKYTPYKFVSPWPRGNQYWYPTEWVSYAMLFADDGYFLHDAPWRTVYGPGANLTQGTHGCINVPSSVMGKLYGWASVGTAVVIQ